MSPPDQQWASFRCFALSVALAVGTVHAHAQTAGFAPANEPAFEDRFVGSRVDVDSDLDDVTIAGHTVELLESYFEILPGRRYRETKRVRNTGATPIDVGIGIIGPGDLATVLDSGRYAYSRTGANTGRITIVLVGGMPRYVNGQLELSAFDRESTCRADITFSSGVHGRFRVLGTGDCDPTIASWRLVGSNPDSEPEFGSQDIGDLHYVENQAIAPLALPRASPGDAPLTYEVRPALPAGLSFDSRTRVLSGTPTAAAASRTYTYFVTDADGDSASLAFTITVAHEVAEPGDTATTSVIPLFTPAGDVRQGFARIINYSGRSGTVRIHGTDDAGRSYGPVTLEMDAQSARDFDSNDLEQGNFAKGLSEGLGDGSGSWRLRLETDLAIEAAAYIRTADGFLASVHDVARAVETNGDRVHLVPIFTPGSGHDQVSWLRLVNLTAGSVTVTIEARDDAGEAAPGGEVRLVLPAGGARRVSARQLESGGTGLVGRLGDGEGRWQLFVSADGDIEVTSLLQMTSGLLTNLSRSGLRYAATRPSGSAHPVGSTFRDCTQCPEMVVVPAGSFLMGSPADEADRDGDEGPVHRVTIGEPFAVGAYEVTFAEWDACQRARGCAHRPADQGWGRETRPVVDVSWDDAQEYVRWLSRETGRPYRLLSEAEWEYVARAGATTRYWWGDGISRNRANCDGCGSAWDVRQTAPVGSFPANAFGLFDVHGNVWERVQDCWNESYAGAPDDGSAWEAGTCNSRIYRGGGWKTAPRYVRAGNRGRVTPPGNRVSEGTETGFRVARTLAEPKRHRLALFRPAGLTQQGLARIINRSRRGGTVQVYGIDDAGERHGPVTLRMDPSATRHLSSDDLENGNASKGLSGGLGNGEGDWRLELATDLEIEPSAYVRTPDGFLTAMHDVARSTEVGGRTVHRVPLFNPASDPRQVSWLRVVNLTGNRVEVTIEARDDEGRAAPLGKVRLALPANSSRRISAQHLESGSPWLRGRIGEGTGRWRLSVSADDAIEVVNLLHGPSGHLSNLSTTARSGFEVLDGGPATVRPLETIHLAVPGGLGDSDYTVQMDLSGTGTFPDDDTIEIEGLTTEDDRILFAIPLTGILPEANTSHRLAVRVRRETDQATSNVLHYSIHAITSVAGPPGFPTMIFEAIVKSMYSSVDDPLLNLKAASMQPGLVTWSAARLGVDTTFSDVLAEAAMQSLFGMPVTELAPESLNPSPSAARGADSASQVSEFGERSMAKGVADSRGAENLTQVLAAFPDSLSGGATPPLSCELLPVDPFGFCKTTVEANADDKEARRKAQEKCKDKEDDECFLIEKEEYHKVVERTVNRFGTNAIDAAEDEAIKSASGFAMGKLVRAAFGKFFQFVRKTKGDTVAKKSLQAVNDANRIMDVTEKGAEMYRVYEAFHDGDGQKGKSDSNRDFDESGRPTKKGRQRNFETLKDNSQSWKQNMDDLLPKAEKDFGSRTNIDDGAQESFSVLVNDIDRRRMEVEGIDDLEGVHTGEKSPREAIGNDPRRGMAVAEDCEFGYEEFPIDDKISTCVFESLVEPECYEGSRQPTEVDLGGSDVCLYPPRDYFLRSFLPDQRCRENYERVHYQGRRTCRWADLGPGQSAWYTLYKAEGDSDDNTDHLGSSSRVPGDVAACIARLGYDDVEHLYGISAYDSRNFPLYGYSGIGEFLDCSRGLGYDPAKCECHDTLGRYLEDNPARTLFIDWFVFDCTVSDEDFPLSLGGTAGNPHKRIRLAPAAGQVICRAAVDDMRAECRQTFETQLLPQIEQWTPLFDSCRPVVEAQLRECEAHFNRERSRCGG